MTDMRTAYCFETDAIEPADLAYRKRDVLKENNHYFCPSDGCAQQVFPHHWHDTGVAWFSSKPSTATEDHILTCPHLVLSRATTTARETRSGKDNTRRVVVPNKLGKINAEALRKWPENAPPSRQTLAAMAAKATLIQLAGDIEEVVNAYEGIKGERTDHPLEINGHQQTYASAVKWIWDLQRPWENSEWQRHIVLAYCDVKAGTQRGGIWFLDVTPGKGMRLPPDQKVSAILRYEQFSKDPKKKGLGKILDQAAAQNGRVKLYWQGAAPMRREKGSSILEIGGRPPDIGFAIRPLPALAPRQG